ncbi:MAG: hypothetical protein ACXQS2_03630, partial [Methermicoccaceae archaeon]
MISVYDYRRTLDELVGAINSGNWIRAYRLAEKLQTEIESMLLVVYNEPNSVTDCFTTLKLRLLKRVPYNTKAKEVREALSDILDKLSKFGVGVAKRGAVFSRQELAFTIKNLSKKIEEQFIEIIVTKNNRGFMSEIEVHKNLLKDTLVLLNSLENIINDYNDERLLCIEAKRFVLKKIDEVKSYLIASTDKIDTEVLRTFLTYVNSFADMIVADEFELESIATIVFELEERVQLDRETKPQLESKSRGGEGGEMELEIPR